MSTSAVTLDFSRAQSIPASGSGVALDFSKAQPIAPSVGDLTNNAAGEGVYKMNGPNGSQGIPFSNVARAQQSGYKLDPADEGRFNKDWAAAPGQRNMIAPNSPSLWARARDTVANSAIGHSLEQAMPKVADALNLHPTESISSPTYQSDGQQLLAPQFLMPGNPQSHVAGIAKGALTGAGKLTSGGSLATMGALAATGGMAAPLAPAATALRVGLGGMGAYGAGSDLYHAGKSYLNGDSASGDEQLGEALPNAALTLPALAHPIEAFGDATKGTGINLMDSYLKAGKKAYRNGAEPGLSVLQQGPGTSVGFTRKGFAQGVNAAKDNVGAQIPGIIDSSTAQIPRASLRGGQDAVLQSKTNVLSGPGGDTSTIPALQDLRSTMSPLVDAPGFASPREVYNAKRNMDENINWGRDMDPKDATVNNTRREMRSDLAGQLYDAVPDLRDPSQQYAGLSAASKLAADRTFDRNGSVFNPFRIGTSALTGLASEGLTHSPGLSTGIGLATGLLPEIAKAPIVKTGGATALYQLGRGIAATGRGLGAVNPFGRSMSIPEATDSSPNAQEPENQNDGFQHGFSSAPYSLRNLTPEIIRPDALSRSKFGLGATGSDGTMVRPIAALPAPVIPAPEATPYSFVNRQPLTAIPARAPERLLGSIGSSAHTLPNSLLDNIFEGGTEQQKAAALRQANLGSYGDVVPRRLLTSPASKDIPRPPQSRKFPGLKRGR